MTNNSSIPKHITDAFLVENLLKGILYYNNYGGSFSGIVSMIEEYIDQLQLPESGTVKDIKDLWAELEIINALALSEGLEPPAKHHKQAAIDLLNAVVRELHKLQERLD